MIVKILPHRPAGTGRPLGTYLLAAKHEHKGERLGPYIPDPDQDKVQWSRTVHSGVADPMQAIGAIERYNAQNTRRHSISRWEHIVVAFTEGERATRKQLEVIEDRLMAAIGFGDHPRISAAHHDAKHFHMHIAVSRIDPTTLKAEHPRHSHFKLQAEAARIEIDLGLRQERKTLLARERREIDDRAALDRSHTGHHGVNGGEMLTPDTQQTMDSSPNSSARRASHERATPSQALYARFKTEKAIALGTRKAAEQAVYDRWAAYQSGLRGFYDLRREQDKLNARQPSRVDRINAHELLQAQQRGDRVATNQVRARQLATARREHPLPTWDAFLKREAERGDREAARILQQNRAKEMQHGHER